MQSIDGHSAACCNIPPVISSGYTPKGSYETIGGLKTCRYHYFLSAINEVLTTPTDVSGPASAKKALFIVYDIFGYFEQTLQGADILAHGAKEEYQVFMPDFFEGNPADIAW